MSDSESTQYCSGKMVQQYLGVAAGQYLQGGTELLQVGLLGQVGCLDLRDQLQGEGW